MQPPILPTPSKMIAYLDRFVRGQTRAKKDIAVAVYNHYLSQAYREREEVDLGSHHILLIGPTGVGKTYLVRKLAEFLGVPVGFSSATNLVEAGYKGDSVESVIRALVDRVGGDPKKAEKGIIFIDEVDKIRRGETGGRDVSGEGVQNALLTLLDGRTSRGFEGMGHPAVNTSRLLFICAGAFVGLREIVERRLGTGRNQIGFLPRPREGVSEMTDLPVFAALCQAQTNDLVEFGMIPEFVGRFATVTVLHELSRQDLREIINTGTERSPLEKQKRLALIHGNELERIKTDHLDWKNTTGSARKWWDTFQEENKHRPALVYRLVEELRNRQATITEFFLSYVYSNTDNIQANLHYLDYKRLKDAGEKAGAQ